VFAGYFGRAERAEPAAAGLAQRYVDALPPEVAEEVVLTGSVSRGVADEVGANLLSSGERQAAGDKEESR
jgi:hypothetical protein